jgi:ribosomal protein S6
MAENTMPATDVTSNDEREFVAYELAYHVLPTVAEGEVAGVTDALKTLIKNHHGEVFDQEAAERFELAYEIEKYLEGRYRKFSSAYFGWVRFRLEPSALKELVDEVEAHKSLLRTLVVRLTKPEEAAAFRFHEALEIAQVRTITADEEVVEKTEEVDVDTEESIATETTPTETKVV